MSSKKKIKLSVVPHPFKTERIDLKVKKQTFRELFEEHVTTTLPIEYALIFDNDIKISPEDYDSLPKSTHVIMKMTPAGSSANANADAQKVGGIATFLVGLIVVLALGWTGVAGAVGVGLMGTGVSLFLGGVAAYAMTVPDLANREQTEQLPSIRGSRNQTRIDGSVPILLGKHLLTPDNAGMPYTTIASNEQTLHQLFCAGYEEIVIDESTIKIGNTPITNYSDALIDIRKDNIPHPYYPSRVVQSDVGIELQYPSGGPVEYIDRTTSSNTRKIAVFLSAPNGLSRYQKSNGKTYSLGVNVTMQYRPVGTGTWYTLATTRLSGSSSDTKRWAFYKALDNDTSGGADYVAGREYEVRVYRTTTNATETHLVDTVYLDNIQSFTASYENDIYDTDVPIDLVTQDLLTTISISIKAENQLKGQIQQLNFEAQLHTLKWDGGGSGPSFWSVAATSNPAAMFRYVLQNTKVNSHPVADAKIDWASLETWYTFCEDNGFECNAVLNGNITVESLLNSICSTARASWLPIDGLYTIVIDTVKPNVIQMFTPRNSKDFGGTKVFAKAPTELKMEFIDAGSGYISAERKVYQNDLVPDDTVPQSANLFGVTNADQAWKIGKYMLAVTELRPEMFSLTVDIENIICTRGDRIIISHDAALIGLASGRIRTVLTNLAVTETEGFLADEELTYEVGKNYSVRIRQQDGTIIDKTVQNLLTTTKQVLFDTNIIGVDVIKDDDLFTYGETGVEILDVLVAGISPSDNLEASLSCLPYSPEIFDADTGTIPDYNPVISVPGDGGVINVISTYDPTGDVLNLVAQNGIAAGNIERAGNALVANRPLAFSLLAEASEVAIIDDGTVVYVDKYDSLLHRTRKTDTFAPSQMGSVVAHNPAPAGFNNFADARTMFVNKEDSDRIWMKGTNLADLGSAITATAGYVPRYVGDDEFLYLDVDGFLYRGLVTDALDGTQVTTFPINDYSVVNDMEILYANVSDGSSLYLKSSVDDTVGVQVGTEAVANVMYAGIENNKTYFINYDDDLNIYRRDYDDPADDGEPVYNIALSMWTDKSENTVFSSLFDSNTIYSGLSELDLAIDDGFFEAQPNEFLITGDLVLDSNRISNVAVADLDEIALKDNIYNSGIPIDAKVTFRGPNYLLMDKDALSTANGVAIQVAGTRIVLDANRVIIDGTVTANLMEASAINSKARTVGGFFKSEYDLDNGTQKLRKDDDTVVLDFDPDRAGSELLLGGTLVGVDGTFSGTLEAANGTFNGVLDAGDSIILKGIAYRTPNSWSQIGNSLNITSTNIPSLAALSSTVLALADEFTVALRTYSFDGTDWSQLGNDFNIASIRNPYIATLSPTDIAMVSEVPGALRTYRFDGTDWSQVGNALSITLTPPSIASLSSTDVAVVDGSANDMRTYRFDGTDWSQVGNTFALPVNVDFTAITALTSTDIAFIDTIEEKLRTYRFDGTDWSQVGNDLLIAGGINNPKIVAMSSIDVVFVDAQNDELRTYRFDGTNWVKYGQPQAITAAGFSGLTALTATDVVHIDQVNENLTTYKVEFSGLPPSPAFNLT